MTMSSNLNRCSLIIVSDHCLLLLGAAGRNNDFRWLGPALGIGIVVQVSAAGGALIFARNSTDKLNVHFNLLVRSEVPPVEDQLAAAGFPGVDLAALGSIIS